MVLVPQSTPILATTFAKGRAICPNLPENGPKLVKVPPFIAAVSLCTSCRGYGTNGSMNTIKTLPAADALDSEVQDFKDSPEDWGLPEDLQVLGRHAKGTWQRQQRYLAAYAKEPIQARAAAAAGISSEAARLWDRGDVLRFRDRLADARSRFDGRLETLLLDLITATDKPNPLLVMFTVKKWLPAYRDSAQPIDGTARDVLDAITAGTRQRLGQRQA